MLYYAAFLHPLANFAVRDLGATFLVLGDEFLKQLDQPRFDQ